MPNGGITPDCVHCKWYRGTPFPDGGPYFEHHKIKLACSIRAFCPSFVDLESNGDNWLDQVLDRQQLQQDMMYVWLGGYEVKFFYAPLASIVEYGTWTFERFLEEVAILTDKHHPNT